MKAFTTRRRVTAAAAAVFALVLLPISSAQADDSYYSAGQSTPRPEIYPYSYNSTWQGGIDRAITNWNATYSPVAISKTTAGVSTITAKSYTDSWFGLYTSCSPNNCMYISLNSRTISASASNFSNYVTSITVHEFGHSFKLGHRDGQDSIMNRDRNRNTMVNPSSSDVVNVRNNYPGFANQ